MNKLFLNLINKETDNVLSGSKNSPEVKVSKKSKPLIIFGFIISLTSIFLLLYTINNEFG